MSEEAILQARETLRSGYISEGRRVKAFENALRDHLGLVQPVAVNSGTSALHLALVIAGVGPGDEVILPAQTFVATGLTVLMQRAKPIFADIEPLTGNIDPKSIEAKITTQTKAIIPVHWGGYPCDLDEINRIAARQNTAVIEDAAHALGAFYRGRPIGAISRFTAFSFQAIKHLTTGDGGALCCLEEADVHQARKLRWFGIDRKGSNPSQLGERIYDITDVGYKYHMNDLAAAVGLGNLQDFPWCLARRQEIGARYRAGLAGVSGITLLEAANDRQSAYWLFTLRVERRIQLIRKLHRAGIPASVVHQRIDRNSVFGGVTDLPNQALFDNEQLAIPLHAALSNEDVEHVVATIRGGW
jgi:perosamine synthetase